MALWVVFLGIVLVGLIVQLVASSRTTSPVTQSLIPAASSDGLAAIIDDLSSRVDTLETDVDDLTDAVTALREENEVLLRRLADADVATFHRPSATR